MIKEVVLIEVNDCFEYDISMNFEELLKFFEHNILSFK